MFRHFIITAYRNFIRRRQYSFLSILVMVIGLTTAFLTLLYASYEFSYESHITDADNIYRVENTYHFPGSSVNGFGFTGFPAGPAMVNYFSEVVESVRAARLASTLKLGENRFDATVELVDPNFLSFFGVELKTASGDFARRDDALDDLRTMLLSETTAQQLFGSESPLGQVITMNDNDDYRVTGVFKDLPDNTHLAYQVIVPFDRNAFRTIFPNLNALDNWNGPFYQTYVRLAPGASVEMIRARLEEFTNANYYHPNPARSQMTPSIYATTRLESIKDIHLFSENIDEAKPSGTFGTVIGMILIAGLILVAVVINYINLATALSTLRAREISLRKTLGAHNSQVAMQFLAEAVLLALIAMLISLLLVELTLPYFSQFLNLGAGAIRLLSNPAMVMAMLCLSIMLGLLAGLYPAFYLSRIKPVEVLSSNQSAEQVTVRVRSLLVTLQFAVSIGLLVAISVVFSQISFVTKMDIGVKTDDVLVVRLPNQQAQESALQLKEQIELIPGVIAVGASSTVPADGVAISTAVMVPWAPTEDALSAWYANVDEGFFEVYGLAPVAGRVFSANFPADRINELPEEMDGFNANVLVNETALKFLSIASPQEAIGKQFRLGGSNFSNGFLQANIVGVVPDFQFGSAYSAVQPTFFLQRMDQVFSLSVRTQPESFASVRGEIETLWKRLMPDVNLTQDPLEELITAQYDQVNRQGDSLLFLSIVAVLISCLGLLGMSSFMVQRRNREIGIRKVLGAKVAQIVGLLIMQFSRPVVWANILAWPVAWYLVRDWLDGFNYRIDLSPIPFLLAGMFSLVLAWLVVGIHAYRAAKVNPIKVLRHD